MTTPQPGRLPRRDFLLLPLISLLTVLVLWGGTEIAARLMFSESGRETCIVRGSLPMRMKPDCVSHRKAAEGPVVEMAYNDCGYRTRQPCGPKPPGTLRIALLGASTAQGFKVPYDESFSARLGRELTAACGRPVEVQNMAVPGYELVDSYMRLDEALAMKPDAVMFLFGPYDVEAISSPQRLADRDHPDRLRQIRRKAPEKNDRHRSLFKRLVDLTADSRALVMVQHFLYSDRPTYVKLFMMYGDKADYVRPPFTRLWQKRLAIADLIIGDMARKVHAAGIPLIDVLAPAELQVSLVNTPDAPGDPAAIDKALAGIAARHGVITADTLEAFRGVPSTSDLFYAVDGHLNGAGHAILAQSVVRRLTDGSVAPFSQCRRNRLARVMP
jgi:GDSL-like Lipase/Acylhydrolase family